MDIIFDFIGTIVLGSALASIRLYKGEMIEEKLRKERITNEEINSAEREKAFSKFHRDC